MGYRKVLKIVQLYEFPVAHIITFYLFIWNFIQFKQPFGGFVWWGGWFGILLLAEDDVDGEVLAVDVNDGFNAGAILTIV